MTGILGRLSRALHNAPLFATTVVGVLALGIGVATAGFSVADRLVFQPIPGVADGENLVGILFGDQRGSSTTMLRPVSYDEYADLRSSLLPGTELAGYLPFSAHVGTVERQRQVSLEFVTPNYFRLLGVTRLQAGRPFTEEEDRVPDGSSIAILGHGVAVSLYGTARAAVGQTVRVNSRPFTVVGVAPRGFRGLARLAEVGLWLPGRAMNSDAFAPEPPGGGYYEFVARLRPGTTFQQLAAQIRAVSRHVLDQVPMIDRSIGFPPAVRERVRDTTALVLAVGGAVLLVAWANAANLLVLRAAVRRREIALQRLLGASWWDLLRDPFIEGVMLAVAGAFLGLLIAATFAKLFANTTILPEEVRLQGLSLDLRVLVFASAASLLTAILLTCVPVALGTRARPMEVIQLSAMPHRGRPHLRGTLAAVQFGLSLSLLTGALLLIRTLGNLERVELGFNPDAVMAFQIRTGEAELSEAEQRAYYHDLLSRIQQIPGVAHSALANSVPFGGAWSVLRISSNRAGTYGAGVVANSNAVSPGYFQSLHIPVLAGRDFAPAEFLRTEPNPQGVVIVTDGLAKTLFVSGNAVGSYLDLGQNGRYEIVGVVPGSKWRTLGEAAGPYATTEFVYRPLGQGPLGRANVMLLVRLDAREGAARTLPEIRDLLRTLAPSVPFDDGIALSQLVADHLSGRQALARLLLVLTLLTLLLAAIGLYGLLGYEVSTRRRELAIRMSLGAQPRNIWGQVMADAAGLVALGIAGGAAGGWALGRAVGHELYGVGVLDPLTYLLAAGVLVTVAALACVGPVRRATAIDPMDALRAQ